MLQSRDIARHRQQDMRRAKTLRISLRQDETRDIIQMLQSRDIARHRQQDMRRAKTLRIR